MTNNYRYPPGFGYATSAAHYQSNLQSEVQEQALAAFTAIIEQQQQQLRDSRNQTAEILDQARRLIEAVTQNERRPRREESVVISIQDGDTNVQFQAPKSALRDPEIKDTFIKAKSMLERVSAKRNARHNT